MLRRAVVVASLVAAACRAPASRAPEPAAAITRVRIETSKGAFVLEVNRQWAPRGADRFLELVRTKFFDDSRFFRVREKYIAQFGIAGDPAVTKKWDGKYFPDDSVRTSNVRGTFAFAMTGPNLRNTQIYINLVDNKQLDAQGFSPVGRVVEGMDVVDRIYSGYGEDAGGGLRLGKQQKMLEEGNRHLDANFPKLDRLVSARVVR
ncbi:MAG TPA: peptidylprolyl isomerase [Gemmatimonadaceae bacterium]|jgi:cyclophilin family peptidyl-prolyl cis-trans isomerase|nr:peptidylprolyl isomerase [Gemmatimonadaceae bacterium]